MQKLTDLYNSLDLDYDYTLEEFNEVAESFLQAVESYNTNYNYINNEVFYNKFFDVVSSIDARYFELFEQDSENYNSLLNEYIYNEICFLFKNPE
jgi:hypothetical protein